MYGFSRRSVRLILPISKVTHSPPSLDQRDTPLTPRAELLEEAGGARPARWTPALSLLRGAHRLQAARGPHVKECVTWILTPKGLACGGHLPPRQEGSDRVPRHTSTQRFPGLCEEQTQAGKNRKGCQPQDSTGSVAACSFSRGLRDSRTPLPVKRHLCAVANPHSPAPCLSLWLLAL